MVICFLNFNVYFLLKSPKYSTTDTLALSEQLCVIFGSGDFKIHVILTYEPQ